MDNLLYWLGRCLVGFIAMFPLRVVARFGRGMGAIAFWLDRRHRNVAVRNIGTFLKLGEDHPKVWNLAQENFRRIGENYCSAIKTATMTHAELKPHLEWVGVENLRDTNEVERVKSKVFAVGHFGNFELYARNQDWAGDIPTATTYRGLKQPGLDRLMQQLRKESGCLFFERRRDAEKLKQAMGSGRLFLGLLADQHAGDRGLWIPFLGKECSTSVAPAVFALRYRCPLYMAICFRIGLASWRIEFGPEIPTYGPAGRRSETDIMMDVNRAFEEAIRRDPANWFWVHNRWKSRKVRAVQPATGNVGESDES